VLRRRRQRACRPHRRGNHQHRRWRVPADRLGARRHAGVYRQALHPSETGRHGE
jgi:hypothetical protein